MSEPSTPMRERLQALPDVTLPDALWHRVEAGRRTIIVRRRTGASLAALALVAILAAPMLTSLPAGDAADSAPTLAARSDKDFAAELRAIDHALQVAYDRGASDAEIAPMWETRNLLVSGIQSKPTKPRNNRT